MGSHRTSTADKPTTEMAGGAGTGKFITVKFGNNESLLCNADCLAANLLRSLVARAHLPGDWGVSPQPDRAVSVEARVIDLTDTSGVCDISDLVWTWSSEGPLSNVWMCAPHAGNLKELHRYRFKRANQLLSASSASSYILVERLPVYAGFLVSILKKFLVSILRSPGTRLLRVKSL